MRSGKQTRSLKGALLNVTWRGDQDGDPDGALSPRWLRRGRQAGGAPAAGAASRPHAGPGRTVSALLQPRGLGRHLSPQSPMTLPSAAR